MVCAGLQLVGGHDMAEHVYYFQVTFFRQLDRDSACCGVGPEPKIALRGLGYARIPAVVGGEELVYLGHVTDVVLLFAVIPSVVAADDFDVLKGCIALIGVADKALPVVVQVGKGVDDGLVGAVVGCFPVVKYSFYAEAEISTKIL